MATWQDCPIACGGDVGAPPPTTPSARLHREEAPDGRESFETIGIGRGLRCIGGKAGEGLLDRPTEHPQTRRPFLESGFLLGVPADLATTMLWSDQIASRVSGPQLINDSKTPSGRVHVGALRGVLIHDAVFRSLKEQGIPARYSFGVDDYDPLDEIPAGLGDHFGPYLGAPLCNVPPPPGSAASDVAEHYIQEFFEIFVELGVDVEQYRMREVYRSGRFNAAIDTILGHAAAVRQAYLEVSGAKRPDNWFPFQVICEQCGRIGTTEVTAYEGGEVVYTCKPDLVTWARGCGNRGKVSPFDGRGKLPWKLEWTAKWATFGITIEGAGKDHNTKGGSRDVAARCLREIFHKEPPLNIPYEFFLVGGAKMSSSRGVGAAARNIADLLPPEVLRYLLIRPQPKQPVNFEPSEKFITKLFNEFDRNHWRSFHDEKVTSEEKRVYQLSEIRPEGDYYDVGFPLILALLQLPHLLSIEAEVEKRKGAPLTEVELAHLRRRIESAKVWLENYASEDERLTLQETLPTSAHALSVRQRAFLHRLAAALETAPCEEDALQSVVFHEARLTPIEQPQAFQAIYQALLGRNSGPKAGNLLAFLDRGFVIARFRELPYTEPDLWQETAVSEVDLESWVGQHRGQIVSATTNLRSDAALAVVECVITLSDDKTHVRRLRVEGADTSAWQRAHNRATELFGEGSR